MSLSSDIGFWSIPDYQDPWSRAYSKPLPVKPIAFEDSRLYRRLKYAKHGTFLIPGTGQWGKTVAENSLANERLFDDRKIVLVNYDPAFVRKYYPSRYRAVKWPKELKDIVKLLNPGEDFVILDDAIFLAGARDTQTHENKDLQKLMTIISHHELFLGVTIQNTSLLDFSMIQAQDVFMLHKHMDPLSLEFERPAMKMRQITANMMFNRYWRKYPNIHPKAWTWSSTTNEMFALKMPSWWDWHMSKAFMGVIPT